MSRRKIKIKRRELAPDPVYNDRVVTAFINYMIKKGKKSVAERIFYKALDLIKEKNWRRRNRSVEKILREYYARFRSKK